MHRLLAIVLAFNFHRVEAVGAILREYWIMCERGWDINVIFLSTDDNFPSHLIRNCTRIGVPIGVQIHQHPLEIGIRLAYESRLVLKTSIYEYDVFVYHEDDTIVTGELV
jgi:hypothetical protein